MPSFFPAEFEVFEAGAPGARIALVLHGGGGPQTVAPVVEHLASSFHVVAPTHPGWNGTSRSDEIGSIAALASTYLEHLHAAGGHDVVLVGSSIGGWIALEMAVQAAADGKYVGLIGAVIDIDGVGVVVEDAPIADFFALDARGLAEVAWHDPDRGYTDPAVLTEQQRAVQQSNERAMAEIAGRGMSDETLLGRLGTVAVPVLVVFGESDRFVTPAYGRAVAEAIPGGEFAEVAAAGHLPQLENPEATWAVIDSFVTRCQLP
ncbi:alpha/beta fold hydrolase [Frigoribacterium sp. PhB24]|uniref:alpha/beta fold hydrolase n=1 Tax=Frigoribacterium sp. PhB24 TaxID=2485204 RepID=UPI000F473D2C|nr:alpha/beta hydrolase [Frigoribacterium sp. PhB24]ROS54866.1 pimeloyl-ACP methyl ester carboxylesterase [Frigoribacterium sp. PhB24]